MSDPLDYRKEPVFIPGAGTFAMYVLLASLSMLFLASLLGYFWVRHYAVGGWPPANVPAFPRTLWISTVAILASSGTMLWAHHAVQHDDNRSLVRGLIATLALGLVFLVLQIVNWVELHKLYLAVLPTLPSKGPHQLYMFTFYEMTALHAAHVLGGLIPLGIVLWKATRHAYHRNFHPGVRHIAIYWHFLDVVWVVLFAVLVLGS